MLLVTNVGEAHFSIDLPGTSVHTKEDPEALYVFVDDLQVQVVHTSRAQIGAAAAGKSGLELLHAHEAWESEYLAKQLGVKLEPRELILSGTRVGPALLWWVEIPAQNRAGHGFWVYATFELGGQTVGLSAVAMDGLEPLEVATRLVDWLGGMKTSASYLDPRALGEDLRARRQAGEVCPSRGATLPTLGVDRRLRLDDVAASDREELARIATEEGGVERSTVDGRRRYHNHVCRFSFDYPDGWEDFWIQDFSPKGCQLNLATPRMVDHDDGEKITNAVYIWATRATSDFGPEQFQKAILETIEERGARIRGTPDPPLEGAIGANYETDLEGTHFVGEVMTVQRGSMVYNVHFNSTRGTVDEGRKHLLRWLDGLRLDVE